MTPRKLILLKAGTTFPEIAARLGDFDAWLQVGLSLAGVRDWRESLRA